MVKIEELKEDIAQLSLEIQYTKDRIAAHEKQVATWCRDKQYWTERLEAFQTDLEDLKTSLSVEEEAQKLAKEIGQ